MFTDHDQATRHIEPLTMTDFALHPQLAQDTLAITNWPLCRVLRMNDTTYPWLILVPARPNCREITDLPRRDRHQLMDEISLASEALRRECNPAKINIAALGNMVPQLHIHVIARFTTDPAWPKPIWGMQPLRPFGPGEAQGEISHWRQILAAHESHSRNGF
jgi:diadenosine tetraphosphate (Ap4A) HIT family hydrolase